MQLQGNIYVDIFLFDSHKNSLIKSNWSEWPNLANSLNVWLKIR